MYILAGIETIVSTPTAVEYRTSTNLIYYWCIVIIRTLEYRAPIENKNQDGMTARLRLSGQ